MDTRSDEKTDLSSEEVACFEEEALQEGVRRIVVSRERTPRSPNWQRAWWRTLQRYNARLSRLHGRAGDDESC